MGDILKAMVPIFAVPTNYNEVLKRLAGFLFYDTLIGTFLLRGIPEIDTFLRKIESYGAIGAALSTIPNYSKLNLSGLAIALLVAGIGYWLQLHNRISDFFAIRRRFDESAILLPLAVMTGAKLSPTQLNSLRANRETVMHLVFYKYASSRADKPLVDKHDIEHALGAWSWYWAFIEAITVFAICGVIALFFWNLPLVSGFIVISAILWLLALLQFRRLERYARPQVETIAANTEAAAEVKTYLCTLS